MKMHFGPRMKVNTEQKEVENNQGIELYKMPPVILATENENKTEQFVNNWYEECEKQLKTQADVAALSGIDQADISRLERRTEFDDCHLATLRRYIEALGGAMGLVATFGAKKIELAGAHDETGECREATR